MKTDYQQQATCGRLAGLPSLSPALAALAGRKRLTDGQQREISGHVWRIAEALRQRLTSQLRREYESEPYTVPQGVRPVEAREPNRPDQPEFDWG